MFSCFFKNKTFSCFKFQKKKHTFRIWELMENLFSKTLTLTQFD